MLMGPASGWVENHPQASLRRHRAFQKRCPVTRRARLSMKAGYISGGLTWVIWVGYLFLIRKHFGAGESRGAELA